jgi:hypothetical protein
VIRHIEVPVEKIVIKEIPVEVVREVEKIVEVPVEVIKERTIFVDRPYETIREIKIIDIEKLMVAQAESRQLKAQNTKLKYLIIAAMLFSILMGVR